jgi:hypothetical protein
MEGSKEAVHIKINSHLEKTQLRNHTWPDSFHVIFVSQLCFFNGNKIPLETHTSRNIGSCTRICFPSTLYFPKFRRIPKTTFKTRTNIVYSGPHFFLNPSTSSVVIMLP